MVPKVLVPIALVLILLLASGGVPADAQSPPPGDRAYRDYVLNGPVHFAAGELVPLNGLVVMNTLDTVSDPVGGLFCQAPAGSGSACDVADPTARSFCHGVSLNDGENWDSTMDTYVYIGHPFDRLAPGVWCPQVEPATIGVISWWPNPDSL